VLSVVNISTLLVFIPTFFFISATPGMCMTLAMTLGISIGVRRTLWMMMGELLGVGLVALAAVLGVASVMLAYPDLFVALKIVGGAYLLYLGVQMWLSKGRMAIDLDVSEAPKLSRANLWAQGFVTAIANPKGWAFFVAVLPPFLEESLPLWPQLGILLGIILCLEFTCMMLYASGGKALRLILARQSSVQVLNRIAGSLMMGLGLWMFVV